jgi:hypothetical protein
VSLQTIENLVSPEPLKTVQRLVKRGELVAVDPADRLDGAHMPAVERINDVAHLASLVGELMRTERRSIRER